MKHLNKLIIFCMIFSSALLSKAQVVIPDESPFATLTQDIGFNHITIEYTRPSVRGRVIFGETVPYRKNWLKENGTFATITFSEDVLIQDNRPLKAGTYAIYAIPGKDTWNMSLQRYKWHPMRRFPFYQEPDEEGEWNSGYSEDKDALRFNVIPEKLKEQLETFTIQLANASSSGALVQLMWDYTRVSFRISTETDKKVLNSIKKFTSNPEARLAGEYYLAAKYYLDTNRELDKAIEWIDKSLQYEPDAYWVLHTKAEIYAKMGNYASAIEAAELSSEKAKEKKADDFVKMNLLEIERWKNLKKTAPEKNKTTSARIQ